MTEYRKRLHPVSAHLFILFMSSTISAAYKVIVGSNLQRDLSTSIALIIALIVYLGLAFSYDLLCIKDKLDDLLNKK